MSTQTLPAKAPLTGLLGSEARRLYHRRVVRLLCLLAAASYVLVIVVTFFTHAKHGDVDGSRPPFGLDTAKDGTIGLAVGMGMLTYILGTTYAGAEWAQRTIVALLFWEPRRNRVTAAKVAVMASAGAIVYVVAEVVWLVTAFGLAATRGTTSRSSDFWSGVLSRGFRGLIFVILMGLLGFALANLVRHSAASLGIAFVYVVVVENLIRGYWSWATQWLLTENATALLNPGGWDSTSFSDSDNTQHLSNLHGGLVWVVATAAVLTLGGWLFYRRDAT